MASNKGFPDAVGTWEENRQIRPYGARIATEEILIKEQVFCNFKNLFFVCLCFHVLLLELLLKINAILMDHGVQESDRAI